MLARLPLQKPLFMKPLTQSSSARIIPLMNTTLPPQRLCLATFNGQVYLQPSQVLYIKADGNYCDLWLQRPDGCTQCYHLALPLKEVAQQLDESFMYIHRSVVIRLEAVQSYRNGRGGKLELRDGSWHNLAARRKKAVLDRLAEYTQQAMGC